MTALVGQFVTPAVSSAGSVSPWYRARCVEYHTEPVWLLGQMWSMWRRTFRWDAHRMCGVLLERDWSLLVNTDWPAAMTQPAPHQWGYVNGVGLAHHNPSRPPVVGQMPFSRPAAGQQWAYLWEHGGRALHVYAAAHGRWHHIATLPVDVLTRLTDQLVIDIQVRRGWMEDAA